MFSASDIYSRGADIRRKLGWCAPQKCGHGVDLLAVESSTARVTRVMDDANSSAGSPMGIGYSTATDPKEAATEAVRAALGARVPGQGDLITIFPTIGYDPETFHHAAMAEAGGASVVGATGFGWLTSQASGLAGCAAAYLPADGLSFGVAAVEPLGGELFATAARAVELAHSRVEPVGRHSTLLVLSDGLAGDQREVMRGCYSVAGATVPIVGGAAGEDLRQRCTYQFGDGKVMTNGLVVVWISSVNPLAVGVDHGWRPIGETMIVTRATGNVIHELDGRRATEVYFATRTECAEEDESTFVPTVAGPATPPADLTNDSSFRGAMVMDGPLGLPTTSGRFDIRHVLDVTPDGGLVMFGYVSEQSVVHVMTSSVQDMIAAAGRAGHAAAQQLRTHPRGALVFSCTARAELLGPAVEAEISAVAAPLGDAPVCGLFTYGEFGRVKGSTGFHNATITVLAF